MGLFPIIEADSSVQVNDKLRIRACQSFISGSTATITNVEIETHTGDGFVSVYNAGDNGLWYLDWAYSTAGTKVISVKLTDSLANVVTMTMDITCLTEVEDNLFSTDSELKSREDEVMFYLPEGRSSFKYLHRRVQADIMDWLADMGLRNTDKELYTKDDVLNKTEIRKLSTVWALHLIYTDLVKRPDDVFDKKSKFYEDEIVKSKQKAKISLDYNKDGLQDSWENYDLTSSRMSRG